MEQVVVLCNAVKNNCKIAFKDKISWFCKAEISEAWNSWILHSGNFASTVAEIAPFACQMCGGEKARIQNVNLREKICPDILFVMKAAKHSWLFNQDWLVLVDIVIKCTHVGRYTWRYKVQCIVYFPLVFVFVFFSGFDYDYVYCAFAMFWCFFVLWNKMCFAGWLLLPLKLNPGLTCCGSHGAQTPIS